MAPKKQPKLILPMVKNISLKKTISKVVSTAKPISKVKKRVSRKQLTSAVIAADSPTILPTDTEEPIAAVKNTKKLSKAVTATKTIPKKTKKKSPDIEKVVTPIESITKEIPIENNIQGCEQGKEKRRRGRPKGSTKNKNLHLASKQDEAKGYTPIPTALEIVKQPNDKPKPSCINVTRIITELEGIEDSSMLSEKVKVADNGVTLGITENLDQPTENNKFIKTVSATVNITPAVNPVLQIRLNPIPHDWPSMYSSSSSSFIFNHSQKSSPSKPKKRKLVEIKYDSNPLPLESTVSSDASVSSNPTSSITKTKRMRFQPKEKDSQMYEHYVPRVNGLGSSSLGKVQSPNLYPAAITESQFFNSYINNSTTLTNGSSSVKDSFRNKCLNIMKKIDYAWLDKLNTYIEMQHDCCLVKKSDQVDPNHKIADTDDLEAAHTSICEISQVGVEDDTEVIAFNSFTQCPKGESIINPVPKVLHVGTSYRDDYNTSESLSTGGLRDNHHAITPIDDNYSNDDALSLYAESLAGLESVHVNNPIDILSKELHTTVCKKTPEDDKSINSKENCIKLPENPKIKIVCEKQSADSTSLIRESSSVSEEVDSVNHSEKSKQPEQSTESVPYRKTVPAHIDTNKEAVTRQLSYSEIRLMYYPIYRNNIFTKVCYFNLFDSCKKKNCQYPHVQISADELKSLLKNCHNNILIPSYRNTKKERILWHRYIEVFVADCIRRKLPEVLMDMAVDIAKERYSSNFDHTKYLALILLEFNTLDLSACEKTLSSVLKDGSILSVVFFEVIANSPNFTQFKDVFIKLSNYILRNKHYVPLSYSTIILERVCILPHDEVLANAVLAVIQNTDHAILENPFMERFELRLQKDGRTKLHHECRLLRNTYGSISNSYKQGNRTSLSPVEFPDNSMSAEKAARSDSYVGLQDEQSTLSRQQLERNYTSPDTTQYQEQINNDFSASLRIHTDVELPPCGPPAQSADSVYPKKINGSEHVWKGDSGYQIRKPWGRPYRGRRYHPFNRAHMQAPRFHYPSNGGPKEQGYFQKGNGNAFYRQ